MEQPHFLRYFVYIILYLSKILKIEKLLCISSNLKCLFFVNTTFYYCVSARLTILLIKTLF